MQQGLLDALVAHPTPILQLLAHSVCVKRAISVTALQDAQCVQQTPAHTEQAAKMGATA
jgi:hypothetical protein